MSLERAFEKWICAMRNLGNVININLFKSFKDLNEVEVTKYHCDKCYGNLVIVDHNATEIIYECLGCGKIHKAYKNRLLGRF